MLKIEKIPIEELDLSVRGWKYCKKYKINTIGDLMKLTDHEILVNVCYNSKIVYNEIQTKLPNFIQEYQAMHDYK